MNNLRFENFSVKPKNSWGVCRYVAAAYLTFWSMVLFICGGASMVFHAPPLVMRILSNICAWSPTIVLLAMFRRLRPGVSIRRFFAECFSGKIRLSLALLCIAVTAGVFLISAALTSFFAPVKFQVSMSIPLSVILSLLSGPTGEELGWRGYLRPEMERRFGFLGGNILVGIIWAFWHTVLWFVDNDFSSGLALTVYIISNVAVMTALNLIMVAILRKENNLFYAVLIHFCFNLPYSFISAPIEFYAVLTVLYACAAAVTLLLFRKD